ncbi:hypothetical protein GCM10010279_70190 [Streptomyces mutabilis]|nr:hypothetical protein GCM10010279_70190 [Streptomyces mutabilis]
MDSGKGFGNSGPRDLAIIACLSSLYTDFTKWEFFRAFDFDARLRISGEAEEIGLIEMA